MTVEKLIEKLKKLPKDHEVILHERGSIYDTKPRRVFISEYDKNRKAKVVTIEHH